MMGTMKAQRRQYGTGSITQRTDGRWMGRLEAGYTARGTRRRLTVYGDTEAEVKRKLEAKRRQIARDGPAVSTSTRTTVKAWADTWMATRVLTQRPKAYSADEYAVRHWIVPTIGKRRLSALTPADIRAVAMAQRQAGRAPATTLRTHRVLIKMLKAAILEGHDVPHRILLVEAPRQGVSDRDALTVDDAVAILAEAAQLPHGSRWATALLQGMRTGECLGLTWDNVDFDRRLITVAWQLQALPYLDKSDRKQGFRLPDGYEARHLARGYHLVRPKTRAGWRVIPMTPWIHDALRAWREIAPPSPHNLVWPALSGGPANINADREEWKALQGAAGLRRWHAAETAGQEPAGLNHPAGRYYVPHEARHTTATLLLEAGIDTGVITTILGHSSILTTRGYQHVHTAQAAAALERIAEQLQLQLLPGEG